MSSKDIQQINGNAFEDNRGVLKYNNGIDLEIIKRLYIISNSDLAMVRAWQGHKIEKRWFSAIEGRFRIKLVKIDDWEKPSMDLDVETYELKSDTLDYLLVPPGYVSSIQSLDINSKLMVMSDYLLGEIEDEYRFEKTYWK